jgi:spermidine synthase
VGSEVLETETLASRLPEGRTSLSGEASGREKVIRTVVLLGLGLSGMAALIYEVVWTRSLSTVMGSSTYALSTMLAAFMAGLSIGGLLGARLSPRLKNPAMAFGLCELGIGIFGMATIPAIRALTPLYIASFYLFHMSFNAFNAVQFVIIFAVMGVPTTLMGITFPLAVKIMTRNREEAGKESGNLYCINTFGAIMGALSAGFLLIPLLGAKWSAVTAASLNVLVATAVMALSLRGKPKIAAVTTGMLVITVSVAYFF